ncbi:alpha/beta fold hydrolase [Planctomycetota bacterium]|nr:alpha/beta fold hydrolase [Planctomycetota bacterium]
MVAINVLAFSHAGSMTRFGGERSTPGPGELGWGQRMSVLLSGPTVARPVNVRTPGAVGLPFSTQRVRVDEATELETWWVPHADPRGVVVLCHGYAASKTALLDAARGFYDQGFSCLLVGFRGSGGSTGNVTTLGYHEAGDVAAAVALAQRLAPEDPVVLYGVSMGAAAALRAVHVEGVAPDALIVEAPFDRLLTTVRNRFALMGAPSFPAADVLVFWGSVRRDMDGFAHNPVDYARTVTCPTLVLHGALDDRVSVSEVTAVHAAVASERKWLHVFPDLGHESYVAARPEAWGARVSEFLATALAQR